MKKFLSILLALTLVFSLAALTGCSSDEETTGDGADTNTGTETGDNGETGDAGDQTGREADEETDGDTTIIVGATSTPHGEVLEQVKDVLAEEGYTLEIRIFDDYVLPNTALAEGELDANYFQHTPYLDSYNESNGTDLVVAAKIHYEPFGIYGNGIDDLADLADGATIIIPADDSNETRALLLLQQEGLIELPADVSAATGVTTLDIVDDGGYNIIPVQADTVPVQLANADAGTIAVINGNYALQAGLNIADALASEDVSGDAAQTYANVIAVRSGDENSAKIQALIEALQTDAIKTYMEETYNGAVQPIF